MLELYRLLYELTALTVLRIIVVSRIILHLSHSFLFSDIWWTYSRLK